MRAWLRKPPDGKEDPLLWELPHWLDIIVENWGESLGLDERPWIMFGFVEEDYCPN